MAQKNSNDPKKNDSEATVVSQFILPTGTKVSISDSNWDFQNCGLSAQDAPKLSKIIIGANHLLKLDLSSTLCDNLDFRK